MDKYSTVSVSVTEEISSKKLLTFIQTQIKLYNILTTQESYYYYSYLPQSNRYEIIVFQNKKSIFNSGIFLLSQLSQESGYTLFILEDSFCLYKQKKFLFVKKVSNSSIEDIKSYIEQTYNIIPTKTLYIKEKDISKFIEECNSKYEKVILQPFNKFVSTNTYKYFIYYLLVCILVVVFFIYENTQITSIQNLNQNQYTKEFIAYKKHSKDNRINSLMEFVKVVRTNKIELIEINYLNLKFEVDLRAKDKKQLLGLVESSKKKIELQSLGFDERLNLYIMKVIFYG